MRRKSIAWRQRVGRTLPSFGGENIEPEAELDGTAFDATKAGCDQAVQTKQKSRWREEHAVFIAAYSSIVDMEGCPLEQWRSF